jgi:hypothetical protein
MWIVASKSWAWSVRLDSMCSCLMKFGFSTISYPAMMALYRRRKCICAVVESPFLIPFILTLPWTLTHCPYRLSVKMLLWNNISVCSEGGPNWAGSGQSSLMAFCEHSSGPPFSIIWAENFLTSRKNWWKRLHYRVSSEILQSSMTWCVLDYSNPFVWILPLVVFFQYQNYEL